MDSYMRPELIAMVKALSGGGGGGGSVDPVELEALERLQKTVEEIYPIDVEPGGISTTGDLNNEHQLAVSRRSGWIPYYGEPLTVVATPGITAYVRIYDKNKNILAPVGPGAASTGSYIQVNYSTNSPMTLQLDEYTEQEIGYWRFTYTCGEEEHTDLLKEYCAYVIRGRLFVTEDELGRVTSLDSTQLATAKIVEVLGIPEYISDVSGYSAYGLVDTGWYVFARIRAKDGITTSANTTVEGAGAKIVTGENYVDVAVRFDVAAQSQKVTVNWGTYQESYIFKANDLAVRNLDYRTTFYIYDIAPYATWEYAFTADTTFVADKKYFVKNGDAYEAAEVQTVAYALTADTTFTEGKTYYTKDGDTYTAATVTAGEAVPADTYYEQTTVPVPAYYVQTHPYALTTDTTFQDGVTYYTKGEDDTYTAAEVTVGDAVTPDTYYVQTTAYVQTTDATFQDGETYYTKSGTEYTEAVVTTGGPIPAYYNHSKLVFEGMARNVTYQFNEIVDCPQEYRLPEIPDDGHGAWYEIRLRHAGSYSSTLVVPEGVKVATQHTQAETAGFNMVDLHYQAIDGVKIWRFMNTHSSIPAVGGA